MRMAKGVQKKIRAEIKTKYGVYLCVFEPELDMGGYTVEAPTVQGVVSWGKNLTEAKRKATESIEGVIEAKAVSEAKRQGLVRLTRRASQTVFS